MNAPLGVGWTAGNPEQAAKVLESLAPAIRTAMEAASGPTASWELLRLASGLVEAMRRDLTCASLDQGHMVDAAGSLHCLLLGAKAVPDAEAAADIDALMETVYADLLQHLADDVPPTWRAPSLGGERS